MHWELRGACSGIIGSVKFLLAIFATIILMQEAQVVSDLAAIAASTGDPRGLPGTLLHSGGGLFILLVIAALAVFKPKGMTQYGWRKQHVGDDTQS